MTVGRPPSSPERVSSGPGLGPGGEFDLIRSLVGGGGALPPGVRLGPGDDCAVLEGGVVLGCDMAVEDVHFRRAWLTPREIGYRAAASALSDLAAMAADPVAALVAYALPPEGGREIAPELHAGVEAACGGVGASVVGGDVTSSSGPLVIDVTVVGRSDAPVLRGGARAGDELWVTGTLGAAAAAVVALLDGREPPGALRAAFAAPRPRTAEARWLVERAEVRAMIDLSDGLAGDAAHVAASSGVSVVLDREAVPVADGVGDVVGGADETFRTALSGGEDYELLLAAAPGSLDDASAAFAETFGLLLTRVGTVVAEGEAPVLLRPADGPPTPLEIGGWDHFRPHVRPGDEG